MKTDNTYHNFLLIKLITFLLLIFAFTSCNKKKVKINFTNRSIAGHTFTTNDSLKAGEDLILEIQPVIKYDAGAYFIITHPMGSSIEKASGNGTNLKNKYSKKSGIVWIQMVQGDKVIQEKKINILTNKAVGNMASYIGPKSIITTTSEPCMVIGIPEDIYNNPMPDYTNVNYSLLRPNLSLQELDIKIENLLSHHTFYASKNIGKSLIGIQCDSSYSEEKYVDEEAGWANRIRLIPITKKLRADGKQYTTITTDIIRDKLGNKVMDGTIVTFQLKGNDNSINQYTSVTVDGKAKINFQHPTETITFKVMAISGNVKSEAINIRFVSDINDFKIKQEKDIIEIGPITSYLNQFIANGSKINYKIYHKRELLKEGFIVSEKGIAIIEKEELFLEEKQYILEIEYAGINKKTLINN